MDLRQIRQSRRDIDILRERIDCINADIMRVTTVPRNMPGGSGYASDGLASKVARLVDLRNELMDKCIEYEGVVSQAEAALYGLPEQQRRIIYLRYVKGLSWRLVSREAHHSVRTCFRLHEGALRSLGVYEKRAID